MLLRLTLGFAMLLRSLGLSLLMLLRLMLLGSLGLLWLWGWLATLILGLLLLLDALLGFSGLLHDCLEIDLIIVFRVTDIIYQLVIVIVIALIFILFKLGIANFLRFII